eukprot:9492808-Pyramimonas_sp.AAC.1
MPWGVVRNAAAVGTSLILWARRRATPPRTLPGAASPMKRLPSKHILKFVRGDPGATQRTSG